MNYLHLKVSQVNDMQGKGQLSASELLLAKEQVIG
jgi:hypothetical protein